MTLQKEENILNKFRTDKDIRGIRIISDSTSFNKRHNGSLSSFFKQLKNSLQSVNNISNRQFFKDFSGVYFSLVNTDNVSIVILYDSQMSNLSNLSLKVRIKKLLGSKCEVDFGTFSDYEIQINEILNIKSKCQLFGNHYFTELTT